MVLNHPRDDVLDALRQLTWFVSFSFLAHLPTEGHRQWAQALHPIGLHHSQVFWNCHTSYYFFHAFKQPNLCHRKSLVMSSLPRFFAMLSGELPHAFFRGI
jgi:hypothetical protein